MAQAKQRRLGSYKKPEGGRMVERPALPARPAVEADGDVLEVIWYPHKHAASLLPEDASSAADHTVERGRIARSRGLNAKRWSWQG
jgi:hypothetical protein